MKATTNYPCILNQTWRPADQQSTNLSICQSIKEAHSKTVLALTSEGVLQRFSATTLLNAIAPFPSSVHRNFPATLPRRTSSRDASNVIYNQAMLLVFYNIPVRISLRSSKRRSFRKKLRKEKTAIRERGRETSSLPNGCESSPQRITVIIITIEF